MILIFNKLEKVLFWSVAALVFLVPLVFNIWGQDAFELTKQSLVILFGFLIIFIWGVSSVFRGKEIKIAKVQLNIPIIAFLLLVFLSSALSVDRGASFFNTHGAGVFVLLAFIGIYFVITNSDVFRNKDGILGLTNIFLGSLSLVLFVSLLSFFGILSKLSFLPVLLRQPGFTPAGIPFEGTVILFAIIFSFLIAFKPYMQRIHIALRYLYWVLFSGSVLLLLIADLSSAWIIIALTMLVFLGVKAWQRKIQGMKIFKDVPWLPVLVMLFSIVFLFSPMFFNLNTTAPRTLILDSETSWQVAWDASTDNIKRVVLGSGPGTYGYDFSQYREASFNNISYWQVRFNNAGNYAAEVLGTLGILGFLLYIGVFGVFIVMFLSLLWRSFKTSRAQPLYLPFGIGVFAVIISQFVYPFTITLAFIFWLFLSLFVVSIGNVFGEYTISLTKRFWKIISVGVMIVLSLFIIWLFSFSAKAYIADLQYARALRSASIEKNIQALTSAVELNNRNPQYIILLARVHMDRALEELRKPEELQDKVSISRDIQLALSYVKGEESGEIKTRGVVDIAEARVGAWEALGQIYKSIVSAPGALDWSINAYKQAVSLEPTNPDLRVELGRLYVQREEFDMAQQEFEKAIQLKNNYTIGFIELALVKEKKGDVDSAIFTLERLAVKYRSNIDIRFNLGRLYYNAERSEEAVVQFELVLSAVPNNSNVLYSLGTAYESIGMKEKAIEKFEKVLLLNPSNEDVQIRLDKLRSQ
ncbi:MAG: tetratricopeptide repeat protein [Chloroflexi bacterium]|nr:tetratricopeptide repeat protein [Chloroflexota bacterium]